MRENILEFFKNEYLALQNHVLHCKSSTPLFLVHQLGTRNLAPSNLQIFDFIISPPCVSPFRPHGHYSENPGVN